MSHRLIRRDFLRNLVIVSAAAGAQPLLAACGDDEEGVSADPADQARVYPQGLASGDPKPDSIILWTRVVPDTPGASVTVSYEIAGDETFTSVLVAADTTASPDADHTVRLKVTGLQPYTRYYYRFTAQNVQSVVGRTKTAPAPDQDVDVRFAYASCQDFNGRYYHAWEALAAEPEVDFVLYLGDYVYETEGNPMFQDPTAERFIKLPDGLALGGGTYNAAVTLADYRALYQQYRSDLNLQRVHQLYPFIIIWDDHEFANDCWQDHATDFDGAMGDEQSTERRQVATQAWFEYQPADVSYDPSAGYPNDIQLYRTLRYGQHVQLILTDQRYFRADHLIPEGPLDPSVGKLFENNSLGSRVFVLKAGFDMKEAAASPPPTMLGAPQKQWLIDEITGSDATWKLWGSETQLAQQAIDLSSFMSLPPNFQDLFYVTVDQWDGYRSERAEILNAIKDTDNVIVLVGDIHAFYASELYVDFDNPDPTPAAVEYVVSGISSSPMQEIVQDTVDGNETLSMLGLGDLVGQFDDILTSTSAHYQYANSNISGVAIAEVSAAEFRVEFLQIADVKNPVWDGTVSRVSFRTPAGQKTIETA